MTYSGQSVKRHEDHRLLTGQSAYVDDIKLPSGCWYSSEVQLAQGDANDAEGYHNDETNPTGP